MICQICQGKGKWKERIEISAKVHVPGPCTNINCVEGWHAVKFHSKYHKYGPSTLKTHRREGRALCPECAGQGCPKCRNTGLYLVRCKRCNGTDVEWATKTEHRFEEGKEHKCMYCHNGHRSVCGTIGELLSVVLNTKEQECEREIETGVRSALEKLAGKAG